jgi:hypothetical protein
MANIHSFDVSLAERFGLDEAIFLQHFEFWTRKNKANNKNLHKGRYWSYNSVEAFSELFPYFTEDRIRRTLERMTKRGLILTDNFNKAKYDRTKWYALADPKSLGLSGLTIEENTILQKEQISLSKSDNLNWHKCQMDLAPVPNGFGTSAGPIPVVDPVSRPITNFNLTIGTRADDEMDWITELEEPIIDPRNEYEANKGDISNPSLKSGNPSPEGSTNGKSQITNVKQPVKKSVESRALDILRKQFPNQDEAELSEMIQKYKTHREKVGREPVKYATKLAEWSVKFSEYKKENMTENTTNPSSDKKYTYTQQAEEQASLFKSWFKDETGFSIELDLYRGIMAWIDYHQGTSQRLKHIFANKLSESELSKYELIIKEQLQFITNSSLKLGAQMNDDDNGLIKFLTNASLKLAAK